MNVKELALEISVKVGGFVDGVYLEVPPMWIADEDYQVELGDVKASVMVPFVTKHQHREIEHWVTDERVKQGAVELAPNVYVYAVPWLIDKNIPRTVLDDLILL